MKTKILFLTIFFMLYAISKATFAQPGSCFGSEAWSCYYAPSGVYICACVDTSSAPAQQCSNGQVLACRTDQHCDWECQCMDTSDVSTWLSHGHTCNTGGGGGNGHGGWWHHWHGHLRLGSGDMEVDVKNSFQIFPNPAYSFTTILISLEQKESVTVKLVDMTGRVIAILADGPFEKGKNEIEWNANEISPGIYFMTLEAGDILQTEKIIIAK